RSHRDDGYHVPDGVRVLTDWMHDAGYFTANLRELPQHFGFSGAGKTDWNFTYDGQPFDSDRWDDLKTHQPFLAQINFQETHRAFRAPKHAAPAKVVIPPYYPDHPLRRRGTWPSPRASLDGPDSTAESRPSPGPSSDARG